MEDSIKDWVEQAMKGSGNFGLIQMYQITQ